MLLWRKEERLGAYKLEQRDDSRTEWRRMVQNFTMPLRTVCNLKRMSALFLKFFHLISVHYG